MAVVNPVKLVIENYPDDKEEWLETENNPEDENAGTRQVPFSKNFIERDFQEEADKKFFRLKLGGEVRLKSGYIIKAERVEKDEKVKSLQFLQLMMKIQDQEAEPKQVLEK
jgi:glutaminyl-tRNA synthetase